MTENSAMAEGDKKEELEKPDKLKDPPSIQYLFDPETSYTCYFLVGNPKLGTPVKIGGCRLHLMAHSETFRRMLELSPIAEKGDVPLPDIEPDTFRYLLRFAHGHKDVSYLTLEEAVDLVYVAEKYLVEELKAQLADHIASILTVDNVFVPLQKPECFQTEKLKNSIDKIVQYDTKLLVEKEEFLNLNSFGLLNIVQQEGLAITEIEVWRAVLRWAKHNATSEEGPDLRKLLVNHLKHVRFCTLNPGDFCKEVIVTDVLLRDEVLSISRSFNSNATQEYSTRSSICYNTEPRKLVSPEYKLDLRPNSVYYDTAVTFVLFILTKEKPILLVSGVFQSKRHYWSYVPKHLKYTYCCRVTLWRITNFDDNTSAETPVVFETYGDVEYCTEVVLPLKTGGKSIKLTADNKYKIELCFYNLHPFWKLDFGQVIENDHFAVIFPSHRDGKEGISPLREITYEVVQDSAFQ